MTEAELQFAAKLIALLTEARKNGVSKETISFLLTPSNPKESDMATTLVQEYRILINKHYAAVQTDSHLNALDNNDDKWVALERKSKLFWNDFRLLEQAFITRLEKIT
jgi:O-glycosyl hydrolase